MIVQATTPDLLEAIVAATRRAVEVRRQRMPAAELERQVTRQPAGTRFHAALRRDGVNIIAECKRRSPSRGVLRREYDPVAIARAYESAGAAAISVLTEPTFFDGSLDHLAAVRAAVDVPLLRKDFIVDEYQLVEACAAGADAILLIVAALTDEELLRLHRAARARGLAVLVEIHDSPELDRALAAGAEVVGVNNRNLRTLVVDTAASDEAARRLPANVTAVSESGLKTAGDLARLRAAGYHAFLIGERFMTADDPGAVLASIVSGVTKVPPSQNEQRQPEGGASAPQALDAR